MSDGRLPERLAEVIAERWCQAPDLALPSERRLAAGLGASRAMVREALAILRVQGRIRGGGGHPPVAAAGAAANPVLTLDHTLALEARSVLEGEIAALAAMRAGPEGHARLRERVRALFATESAQAAWQAELELHRELLAACANPLLERLCLPLMEAGYRGAPHVTPERLRAHQRLVAAIGRQQPQLARDLLLELLSPREIAPEATSSD